MLRGIVGFHRDLEGDWVAELDCHHRQHVRHDPPFQNRPWVVDESGRAARTGTQLDCSPCDRAELPAGLTIVRTLGVWDESNLPTGLLRTHRTPSGLWGLLQAIEGTVEVELGAPPARLRLCAGSSQPLPPGEPHRVVPTGAFRVSLQLWGEAS